MTAGRGGGLRGLFCVIPGLQTPLPPADTVGPPDVA